MISVGERLEAIAGREEGVYFHADETGYLLIYNFSRPRQDEIDETKAEKPFEIAFLKKQGIIWILSKCGSLEWTDAPFHPILSPDWKSLRDPDQNEGHALILVMTDAATSIVESVRLIGLGHDFSVALLDRIRETAQVDDFDLTAYYDAVRAVTMAYPTRKLLTMAEKRWKLR